MPSERRIASLFARLAGRRAAFIPYVTAGDPDLDATLEVLCGLAEGGADLIELGVPFSDPMADGPVIEAAMNRALAAGTTLAGVLDLTARFRARFPEIPVVLFGYLNPLHRRGLARVASEARQAGADGFLVVDLPPEESPALVPHLADHDLDFIALFTPTSDDARVAAISRVASGFAYYVSMNAITGDRLSDLAPVAARVSTLRAGTGLPICVGFGISTPDDARAVAAFADGVIVGSALVRALSEVERPALRHTARDLAAAFRAGIDAAARPSP
jgi:tryptophan synthase alpha chain